VNLIRFTRLAAFALIASLSMPSTAAPSGEAEAAFKDGDYATALRLARELAPQGDALAQSLLGLMYRDGRGVPQDYQQAAEWLRKAADQGRANAQSNLGNLYETGRGVTKDMTEAVNWYRKAAEQGNTPGQSNLGHMYESGRGVTKDAAEAANWYRKAAEQGYVPAQINLGALFEKGLGVAQDYAEAVRWYTMAAEQENADAQYKIAVLYEQGTGLALDLEKARYWYGRVLANTHADSGSLETKRRAGERIANLSTPEQIIAYEGGRFVLRHSVSGNCVVALQGFVSRDASFRFDDVVKNANATGCNRPLTMLLESPGGSLFDGISLGREVRSQGFRTVARYDCASACAIIFLGGSERTLVGSRARVGFHQAAFVGEKVRRCDQSMDSPEIRRYLRFVIPVGADRIYPIIMETSCDSIEWVYGQRALELGVATALESESVDVFGPKQNR
jgi:ATP-dependent protease ClpP protease subunit